ncbi:MAG TPA: homocitrate synthase [Desulfomonilaceae bacterium]|nr:homocitrate synthase [Desulfomonilaceae bacterium]
MESVHITDTTLRDGEQTPGVSFSDREKMIIARMLDRFGVREIECGIPAMGPDERNVITNMVQLGLGARLITWNRAVASDIEASIRCGIDAVAISIPVSDFHIWNKLLKSRDWVLRTMEKAVAFAKSKGTYVCAGAEDASRADPRFLARFAEVVEACGADRLRFSDTLGQLDPFRVYEHISALKSRTNLPIEIHAHNDFGLATANTLAGIHAGADFVSTTVLGLGERAGNAALEEVAMALDRLYGVDTHLRFTFLPALCRFVSRASGRSISPGKPVVGDKIFSHESEIHAAAVIKNPDNYEPYPPEKVGLKRRIALGKHSGRRAVSYRLRRLGIGGCHDLSELVRKVRRFSVLAKRELSDADLTELCETGAFLNY